MPLERAVQLALTRIRDSTVDSRWSSAAVPGAPSAPLPTDPDWAGGSLYEDTRTRQVAASPAALWPVIEGIGGDNGWYSFPFAWRVRGLLDRVVGGVGLRRGRRDAQHLFVGRVPGLLAGRGAHPRTAAAAARRDAAAGPGLAGARGRARSAQLLRTTDRTTQGPRVRRTSSARSSIRAACWGTPTGGRWRRSTASCSARWPATSRVPPRADRADRAERAERVDQAKATKPDPALRPSG